MVQFYVPMHLEKIKSSSSFMVIRNMASCKNLGFLQETSPIMPFSCFLSLSYPYILFSLSSHLNLGFLSHLCLQVYSQKVSSSFCNYPFSLHVLIIVVFLMKPSSSYKVLYSSNSINKSNCRSIRCS